MNWKGLIVEYLSDVRRACAACDSEHIAPRIQVGWNPRFTSRMGDARWDFAEKRGLIRLSMQLWPVASDEERRETVIHEACHIIADAKTEQRQHHGPVWIEMMQRCGYPAARRCHSVKRDTGGIHRGSVVRFRFEGTEYVGTVNRITKRATVLVEDQRGTPFSDGKRYLKFYVPLSMLQPVDVEQTTSTATSSNLMA